ncbi:MAG: radical SAM protein [Candidatus Woesearchaeota archaeon]
MPIQTRRVDIKTGFVCNNNCIFCAQAHKKNLGNRTTREIKADLKDARKRCNSVVFTGGEVTIRTDVLELIRYAKSLGFQRIQIQTNGRMLSYKNFCKKIIDAGANEFGPAIHGHCAEIHDSLTRAKGSFFQTISAIKNLKEEGHCVITNTVVVKQNYRHLPKLAELLVRLKVDQFQFAFVHPIGNAFVNFDKVVPRVSIVAPFIKKGLQIGLDSGICVMAEAIPYCHMRGYERYVSENYIPLTEVKDYNYSDLDYRLTRVTEGKAKFRQCRQCKFERICEGAWKEYPERLGSSEFRPVRGKKISSLNEI